MNKILAGVTAVLALSLGIVLVINYKEDINTWWNVNSPEYSKWLKDKFGKEPSSELEV